MCSGGVSHEYNYNFYFMKRGPERKEFYDCLASKIDGVMKTIESKETFKKKLKCAISIVKKCVCIRQNISDPTSVDRRRSANHYYMDKVCYGITTKVPRNC